jgi:hypothetical protein
MWHMRYTPLPLIEGVIEAAMGRRFLEPVLFALLHPSDVHVTPFRMSIAIPDSVPDTR